MLLGFLSQLFIFYRFITEHTRPTRIGFWLPRCPRHLLIQETQHPTPVSDLLREKMFTLMRTLRFGDVLYFWRPPSEDLTATAARICSDIIQTAPTFTWRKCLKCGFHEITGVCGQGKPALHNLQIYQRRECFGMFLPGCRGQKGSAILLCLHARACAFSLFCYLQFRPGQK